MSVQYTPLRVSWFIYSNINPSAVFSSDHTGRVCLRNENMAPNRSPLGASAGLAIYLHPHLPLMCLRHRLHGGEELSAKNRCLNSHALSTARPNTRLT